MRSSFLLKGYDINNNLQLCNLINELKKYVIILYNEMCIRDRDICGENDLRKVIEIKNNDKVNSILINFLDKED